MISIRNLLGFVMLLSLAGCATSPPASENVAPNNPFTHGNVQLTLKKGHTSQTEVLEAFGAPNVATIDSDGNEVWTYQKNATVSTSRDSLSYGTVILAGGKTSISGFEQSSRTMTLILKFDDKKKVVDFKSMTTSF